jgi:hypothetical protein
MRNLFAKAVWVWMWMSVWEVNKEEGVCLCHAINPVGLGRSQDVFGL